MLIWDGFLVGFRALLDLRSSFCFTETRKGVCATSDGMVVEGVSV